MNEGMQAVMVILFSVCAMGGCVIFSIEAPKLAKTMYKKRRLKRDR